MLFVENRVGRLEFLSYINPKFAKFGAIVKPEHFEEFLKLNGSSCPLGVRYEWTQRDLFRTTLYSMAR